MTRAADIITDAAVLYAGGTPVDFEIVAEEVLAEINALRGDAARYRWLRHGDNDEKVLCNGPVDMRYWYLLRKEKLDAAIDAAIKEAKP